MRSLLSSTSARGRRPQEITMKARLFLAATALTSVLAALGGAVYGR
jgi:hypothetical protein